MPSFNASQQAAIDARNPKILVSAAAGSGKTTVMVTKIGETLMKQPDASISQFLVITFTKDAAQNMKEKLRTLLENASRDGAEAASRALNEIETASISTIHSFCTQLLKEYNDNAGASMNPRVLKETEKKRMLDESFTDAVEVLMGEKSPCGKPERKAVHALMTAFEPDKVAKMVQDLYQVLMGIPCPFDFLEEIVQHPPYALWDREIINAAELDALGLEECLRREAEMMDLPEALPNYESIVENDRQIVENFPEAWRNASTAEQKYRLLISSAGAFADNPRVPRLGDDAKQWKKKIDKLRNDMKGSDGILMDAAERLKPILNESNGRANETIQQELRGLELILRETAAQYERQKLEAGAIDYADMEQIAFRIMSDPDKRNELLARYKYIYVDECQDVSGIQDAIIKSLAGPGHQLFMVGDIKQSIYGFRHAEPDLFDQERRAYSDSENAPERRIFFMDNYRSCKSVVDAVNVVFAEAMDRKITDMNYLPEDHLRCNLPGEYGPVDVLLVREGDGEADKLEAQCEAVGKYIQSLLTPAREVSDQPRYRYQDIVILLRTAKDRASAIVEHLKKMHIPAMYEGVPDFYGLAEVKSFLSLLNVIDNPRNDDALVGTLINTPFHFTDNDLAAIRLRKHESVPFYEAFECCVQRGEKPIDLKCRRVSEQLAVWRSMSEGMPVPDFLWRLMRETGIYASRGAYPDGRARQSNLDALYQRALDGQKAGNTRLSDFINDVREERETKQSDSDDHPAPGAGDDFVRVMTMHKSKGLEFPVVILMDLQKNLRGKRSDEPLRINVSSSGGALGLYLPAIRRNQNIGMDSQGRSAFEARATRKNIAETTRLLYVAMTRAQQRLCLAGSVRESDEALWHNETRSARVWQTRSMLDMVMPAVLKEIPILPEPGGTAESRRWRVRCISGKAIADAEEAADTTDEALNRVLTEKKTMRMYLPETVAREPLKTSVTTLTRKAPVLSEEDSEETVGDKRKAEDVLRTFRLSSVASRPAFLEEEKADAANSGTATHRFLRLINLDLFRQKGVQAEEAVRGEAERMKQSGILTEEEAGMIRLRGVALFLESELGRRMLRSDEIRREVPFTLRIDPEKPTMVQGIVDCAFRENGGWILIDYKTDRDTAPETFVPRHERQMNWYREALERLTRVEVREMWLFALRAGKAYPVRRIEV